MVQGAGRVAAEESRFGVRLGREAFGANEGGRGSLGVPRDPGRAARVMAAPYAVVPYETVNVRSGPARAFCTVGTVAAGQPRGAYCWEFGEPVSDYGFTNRVWVKLAEGYVSAVYLKGNEYGDLPASASC